MAHENWRKVWREGIVPLLSTRSLQSLHAGLVHDDCRLVQGVTTDPPALASCRDCEVEGTCALGYCGWQGEGLETVGEVDEFFTRLCRAIDHALGEPTACQRFVHWFDGSPRDAMRRQLLAEVKHALARRECESAAPADVAVAAA